MWLLILASVVTIVVVWFFWINPVLKMTPAFSELYESHGKFSTAAREKFAGIKQRLTVAMSFAASAIVFLWDFFYPIVTSVDTSAITSRVPSWLYPLIMIGVLGLIAMFRNFADRRGA